MFTSAGVLPVYSEASAVSIAFRKCMHMTLQAQTRRKNMTLFNKTPKKDCWKLF